MNFYNEHDEEIKYSYLEKIFHEMLPPEEVHEHIYKHSLLFNREDGCVVKLSFLDFEMDVYVYIYKENRTILSLIYRSADYIQILNEKNKIFEMISTRSEHDAASNTILSLSSSPIVQFNDDLENDKRIMDITPTELMLLFDDFEEVRQDKSSNKSYRFLCKRFSETAELNLLPGTGKLSLIIKSEENCLVSINLMNCDRVVADLKKKKLYFTSGFEERQELSYIECCLDLGGNLHLLIQPNSKPILRGLG
jgi:hypothetical protein